MENIIVSVKNGCVIDVKGLRALMSSSGTTTRPKAGQTPN